MRNGVYLEKSEKEYHMTQNDITQNVTAVREKIAKGYAFHEKVYLVAAIKTQPGQAVNAAIAAGVDAVAENKPQDFRDKNALIDPCPRHFIGHLQTNKVKYLVGNVELFHSCDRDELAEEIAKQSLKKGVTSNVLIQINIGQESTKGGYAYETGKEVFQRLSSVQGLQVKGFMAMLPDVSDETYLRALTKKMRALFEWAKTQSSNVEYLSMGMSGDYMLCIEEGSNMIRLGSTLFGARDYTAK